MKIWSEWYIVKDVIIFQDSLNHTRINGYTSIFHQVRNIYYFQIRFRLREMRCSYIIRINMVDVFDIVFNCLNVQWWSNLICGYCYNQCLLETAWTWAKGMTMTIGYAEVVLVSASYSRCHNLISSSLLPYVIWLLCFMNYLWFPYALLIYIAWILSCIPMLYHLYISLTLPQVFALVAI